MPERASARGAGLDVHSCQNLTIRIGERRLVKTGLAARPPRNTYLQIAPRSGLAVKGIDVGAGVVDEDYRGEIQVLLINNSHTPFAISSGDRIAQLILESIVMANPRAEERLTTTERGTQGFGSTGTNTLLSTARIASLKAIQFDQEFLNQVRAASQEDQEYQEELRQPPQSKDRSLQDGLIYFRNRLQIPDNQGLRL